MEDMTDALKYALKRVDTDRSDKEIVKYVNQALMTRYYTAQSKRNGYRRVRKGGEDWNLKPEFTSAIATVIGREVPEKVLSARLGKQQMEFARKLIDAAESDIEDGNGDKYGVTDRGKFIMTGAYAAEITGLSYEAAKRRLSRIRKKVLSRR
ncbi:hypothetical protein D3C78_1414830 [compost metagenome]